MKVSRSIRQNISKHIVHKIFTNEDEDDLEKYNKRRFDYSPTYKKIQKFAHYYVIILKPMAEKKGLQNRIHK